MTVKLVATDLDGTLVRSDGSVSDRTRAALIALEVAGIRLVLVTGRPPRWMHDIAEQTGHRGVAICSNGAYVYDLHTERVLESRLLDAATGRAVVARLRGVMPGLTFGVETLDGFGREPGYTPRWPVGPDTRVAPIEALLVPGVGKLLARDESLLGDAMLTRALPAVGDVATVTHSNPRDCLLEVSAPGVSKASTLAALCAGIGVGPGEVLAFGDMPNDLPMLAWAGRSVAVTNAHPAVLDAVDEHTASHDADGVASVLETLLR